MYALLIAACMTGQLHGQEYEARSARIKANLKINRALMEELNARNAVKLKALQRPNQGYAAIAAPQQSQQYQQQFIQATTQVPVQPQYTPTQLPQTVPSGYRLLLVPDNTPTQLPTQPQVTYVPAQPPVATQLPAQPQVVVVPVPQPEVPTQLPQRQWLDEYIKMQLWLNATYQEARVRQPLVCRLRGHTPPTYYMRRPDAFQNQLRLLQLMQAAQAAQAAQQPAATQLPFQQ